MVIHSTLMNSYRLLLFIAIGVAALLPSSPSFGKTNQAIKGFLPVIKPIKGSDKASPGDFGAVNKQMIAAMNYLGKHHDSYGKDGSDIIELALQNYGEDMFSSSRAALLRTTLIRIWEKAQSLGLFTKGGNFKLIITQGPEKGKSANFEYIVLPKEFPQFSPDLTNLFDAAAELGGLTMAEAQRLIRSGKVHPLPDNFWLKVADDDGGKGGPGKRAKWVRFKKR